MSTLFKSNHNHVHYDPKAYLEASFKLVLFNKDHTIDLFHDWINLLDNPDNGVKLVGTATTLSTIQATVKALDIPVCIHNIYDKDSTALLVPGQLVSDAIVSRIQDTRFNVAPWQQKEHEVFYHWFRDYLWSVYGYF